MSAISRTVQVSNNQLVANEEPCLTQRFSDFHARELMTLILGIGKQVMKPKARALDDRVLPGLNISKACKTVFQALLDKNDLPTAFKYRDLALEMEPDGNKRKALQLELFNTLTSSNLKPKKI